MVVKSKVKKLAKQGKIVKASKVDKSTQQKALDALRMVKTKFSAAEKEMEKNIKENPKKAILIAGAIGAALGGLTVFALTRKRKDKK